MKWTKSSLAGIWLGLIVIGAAGGAYAQNSAVYWSTFDMGFESSTASNTMTRSALGQNFVGTAQLANTSVESGFLADPRMRGILVGVSDQRGLPKVYSLRQNYPN